VTLTNQPSTAPENRRTFLKQCAALAGGTLLPALPAPAAPAARPADRVRFGPTDLYVSRLCQGTAFRQLPREDTPETRRILYRCLDEGINFFDTAEAYGWGGSEGLLGRVVAGKRDKVVLCTKAAPSHPPQKDATPNKFKLGEKLALTREVLFRKCEGSLKRLGTDYIDLYLIHSPDDQTAPEDLADSLDALVRAGKVRYWGVSNFKADQVSRFIALRKRQGKTPIVGTEDYYSLIAKDRAVTKRDLMPVLGKAGLGLLAFSPLDTGRLAPDRPIVPGSSLAKLVAVLDQVARQLNATRPQVCIAWVLSHAEVTSCLAGAEKPEHVSDNYPGTRLVLPAEARTALDAASSAYSEEPKKA
jgi:aryl-alcohol dehydrogenase-like predicted oxidoreductase